MHRSGTSALSRVLNLMGADLGPRPLIAPDKFNEKGYWENKDIMVLNDMMLNTAKGRWARPPTYEAIQELLADTNLKRILTDELTWDFGEAKCWLIKDPRMALLLPVWEQTGVEFQLILAKRDRSEVAQSISTRSDSVISLEAAGQLYDRDWSDIRRNTEGRTVATVHYNDLLDDWETVVRHIGSTFETFFPMSIEEARPEVEDFLDPSLRNFKESLAQTNPPTSPASGSHSSGECTEPPEGCS